MKKIIIYIIAGIMLLSIGAGATYAYLAVRFKNLETESTINIGMGTMTITYENNSGELRLEKAIPGASVSKEFTLVGKNDTVSNDNASNEMYYKIGIVVDNNTFTRGTLEYTLVPLESSSNGVMQEETTGTVPKGGNKYIGSGYFDGSIDGVTHKYKITLSFPDTGEDQSEEMGKEIGLHITIDQGTKIIDVSNNYPTESLVAEILNKTDEEKTNDGLQLDDYGNLRYVGATPNNYIIFNDETWRIIGIFDIEDEVNPTTIKKGKGIKIIRESSIGDEVWASSINDWSTASLQTYLNGTYYNSLNTLSQSQIAKVTWHLGGWNKGSVSASDIYKYERGIGLTNTIGEAYNVYTGDDVVRTTTWNGYIALMYPSDYGYASNITECLNSLSSCYNPTVKANNWIYSGSGEWFLSPYSSRANVAFFVNSSGGVGNGYDVGSYLAVRPSVYLNYDILKVQGSGTEEDPYVIE